MKSRPCRSFDVLHLLAHLLDQQLQLERAVGDAPCDTDFEPRVLASRLSSCIRKSRRLPAAPPAGEHALDLVAGARRGACSSSSTSIFARRTPRSPGGCAPRRAAPSTSRSALGELLLVGGDRLRHQRRDLGEARAHLRRRARAMHRGRAWRLRARAPRTAPSSARAAERPATALAHAPRRRSRRRRARRASAARRPRAAAPRLGKRVAHFGCERRPAARARPRLSALRAARGAAREADSGSRPCRARRARRSARAAAARARAAPRPRGTAGRESAMFTLFSSSASAPRGCSRRQRHSRSCCWIFVRVRGAQCARQLQCARIAASGRVS